MWKIPKVIKDIHFVDEINDEIPAFSSRLDTYLVCFTCLLYTTGKIYWHHVFEG